MDSARLPGKVLADLCGRPLLGRVLDRVRRAKLCDRVIVATSDRPFDDEIAAFAEAEGGELFRGHHSDVAQRALGCCAALSLDSFVRISGDSPFMPPELIDRGLELAMGSDADLVTNVRPRTYPAGASVEVVRTKALQQIYEGMTADAREHVTSAFYSATADWKIKSFSAGHGDYAGVRLTVDTKDELQDARAMTARLMPQPERFPLGDIVELKRSLNSGNA